MFLPGPVEPIPGSFPGWYTVTSRPGHIAVTHDLDECAAGASACEAPSDGGTCTNTDGAFQCGCQEGYRAMDGSPADKVPQKARGNVVPRSTAGNASELPVNSAEGIPQLIFDQPWNREPPLGPFEDS